MDVLMGLLMDLLIDFLMDPMTELLMDVLWSLMELQMDFLMDSPAMCSCCMSSFKPLPVALPCSCVYAHPRLPMA